jgi:ABC-2 type transport system permease protein
MFGMGLGFVVGLTLTISAVATVLSLRTVAEREAILVVGTSVLLVLWLLAPIVVGGGETVLDLRTLALYPISPPTLVAGILLSAFIGSPAFMTLAVALSLLTHASSVLGAVVLVVGAVEFTLTAVLAGRVSVTAMNILASSRFRSMAAAFTVLAAVSLGALVQLAPTMAGFFQVSWFVDLRRIIQFVPLSWAPEAMARAASGDMRTALLFLTLGAAVPAVLLVALRRTLNLLVLRSDGAPASSSDAAPLASGPIYRLVDPKTAAAWSKSVRSLRRDPREWTEVAAFLPLVLLFAIPAVVELDNLDPRLTLLPFTAATAGMVMTCGNLFGADGPTFTADAFPGDDFRPILVGKLLARGVLVALVVWAGALFVSVVTGGWRFLPLTTILIVQSVILATLPAVFVSIRAPIPVPEKVGGFNTNNAGCIAPLLQVGSLMVTGVTAVVLASPALAIAILFDPLLAVVVPMVTLPVVVWLVSRRLDQEAENLRRRIPEMVAALTRH